MARSTGVADGREAAFEHLLEDVGRRVVNLLLGRAHELADGPDAGHGRDVDVAVDEAGTQVPPCDVDLLEVGLLGE